MHKEETRVFYRALRLVPPISWAGSSADAAFHRRFRAFTFRTAAVAYGRPHCWLKSDIPPARYAQGATSGIVRPGEVAAQPPAFEPNTDRRGSDFRDFAVPENPRACYDD